MEPIYGKNNKEELPLEFYLKRYQEGDPAEMALRCALPWNEDTRTLELSFMGGTYTVSHPEFTITGPTPLSNPERILFLRYLLYGHVRRREEFACFTVQHFADKAVYAFAGLLLYYGSEILRTDIQGSGIERDGVPLTEVVHHKAGKLLQHSGISRLLRFGRSGSVYVVHFEEEPHQ